MEGRKDGKKGRKEGRKEAFSSPNVKTLRLALKICMTFATSSSIPRHIGLHGI